MRYFNAPNTAFGEDRRTYKVGTNGVTSNQTVFNVSYDNGRVEAYLNGVRLYPGDDFTKSSSGIGTNITLASAIGASNVLEIIGYQGINSGNALVEDNFVVGTGSTGSGGSYTNSTTEFPVASSVGDTVSVWRNGVKLVPTTDYTVQAATNKVTLASPGASTDDEITVQVVGGVIHNNGLTVNSSSNSFFLPTTRGTNNYVLTRDDSAGTGGTTWKETISAPVITSVTGEINEDTNTTLTVTGSGFASGMTIKLINSSTGADITGHTTLSYTGSSSPLTVTIPSATTNITAGTSVKLHITNQGLTGTSDAIVVSEDPNWATSAGNIATIYSDLGTSVNVGSALSATAGAGGGTINYVIDSGDTSATTYFDLGLTSGQITTDASNALSGLIGSANSATETFITYAQIAGEEATKKTPRTFNIIINKPPVLGGSGVVGAVDYTLGGVSYRVQRFTSGTKTIEFFLATLVDLMVVGGGGGGASQHSGGGGGGGILYNHPTNAPNSSTSSITIPAGTYTIVVGEGGTGTSAAGEQVGDDGDDTTVTYSGSGSFTTYTAGGGGGGGSYGTSYYTGRDGRANHGSSGGGGSDAGSAGSKHGSGFAGGSGAAHGSGGGGGGGGGAGGSGSDAVTHTTTGSAGDGGAGKQMGVIFDGTTNHYWGGGGGGGAISASGIPNSSGGDGGIGGGGGGGYAQQSGSSGHAGSGGGSAVSTGGDGQKDTSSNTYADGGAGGANTGGGGGASGSNSSNGGAGGSGIVLIRYAI